MLPSPSKEQQIVIDSVKDSNVIVDSVAGSGKTTTVLHIGKAYPQENILVLTYNADLKKETREKVQKYNIPNMEVHSYHAFCCKYYDRNTQKDTEMENLLKQNKNPIQEIPKYTMIILDEAQDLCDMYYTLVVKLVNDAKIQPKFAIIGDYYQSIYEFRGSDVRYITHANKIFNLFPGEWKELKLSTSFRITNEMADFINDIVLHQPRLRARKSGTKPVYCIDGWFSYNAYKVLEYIIKPLINQGYKTDDFFIIAPSIKSKGKNSKSILNEIVNLGSTKYKYGFYVPINDDEKIDKDIIKGKFAISTYHQTKGLERKIVILFGFDTWYFQYKHNENKDKTKCTNDLYVALTRAKEHLFIMHNNNNDYFDFVDKSKIRKYVTMKFHPNPKPSKAVPKVNKSHVRVTDLIERLNPEVINKCKELLSITRINEPKRKIYIPTVTKQGNYTESVAEINGTAIPAFYELLTTGNMKIWEKIKNDLPSDMETFNPDLKNLPISNLLKISNMYISYMSGYKHKNNQIKYYNWITQDMLNDACSRLGRLKIQSPEYEFNLETMFKGIIIMGSIDILSPQNIWEIKCVDNLTIENVLQLLIYSYMYDIYQQSEHRKLFKPKPGQITPEIKILEVDDEFVKMENTNTKETKYMKLEHFNSRLTFKMHHKPRLLNIITAEILEINYTRESAKQIIEILMDYRFNKNEPPENDKFFDNIEKIKQKYKK